MKIDASENNIEEKRKGTAGLNDAVYGARYPKIGFWTRGIGTSNQGIPPHPYETFSYDSALLAAKIQDYNIVPYSSVLPKDLEIISLEDAQTYFYHGAVLEVIMAGIGVTYSPEPGKRNIGIRYHGNNYVSDSDVPLMAAAACIAQITQVKNAEGQIVGGYIVEYVDAFDKHIGTQEAQKRAHDQLTESLDHMLRIRNYPVAHNGERKFYDVSYVEVDQDNKYGYALNAMGFIALDYPNWVRNKN